MSNRYPGGFITLDEPTVNSSSAKGVWTLDQQADYQGQGVWPTSTYQISRSLRFNSADSAYLSRTPASAGNQQKYTFSFWTKRGSLGSVQKILTALNPSSNADQIVFNSPDTFRLAYGDAVDGDLSTSGVFRDISAWYHIVVSVDTTQATSTNRVKLYVNNVEQTISGSYPAQNYSGGINRNTLHVIGARCSPIRNYYNGYLADVFLIDGQALTPSSFGETDETTGVWSPIRYAGTYGTNGFHLDFSDNTSTTTLGYDAAGSNDWTLNNFSVAAGAGNDSLVDTPTPYGTDTGAGGEVRGNYCTWNPLSNGAGTISDGNLRFAGTNAGYTRGNSTIAVSSGKWYFEVTLTTASSDTNIGIGQGFFTSQFPGQDALSYVQVLEAGQKQTSGNKLAYGTSLTSGDVFMCAFDLDNNKIFFGKNGTWFDSSDPAAGTSPAYSLTSGTYCPVARPYSSSAVTDANFGQRPFAYTAPSGFKALCTTNLPEPTVLQGDDHFNTVLWDGSGASQSIATVGFAPDFVWIKSRSNATNHYLYDIIRGANNQLLTNATLAESTVADRMTAFNSDGFTVGSSSEVNGSSRTYVGWNWKGGGAGSSNTDGTLSSTVSTNTTAGISIVTYTGNGTAGATVGHGLGVAPKMIIAKTRNNLGDWPVYHVSLGNTKNLLLNTTGAETTSSSWWNNTTPSSTVITLGNNSYINGNTYTFVAYCFAEVEGFSKFGSYTGNGSTDGVFVYTGFRPAWLLVKRSDVGDHSALLDAKRDTYNIMGNLLLANDVSAEFYSAQLDFTSNGFKLRTTAGAYNTSSGTYIFAAFAENPFKFALAR